MQHTVWEKCNAGLLPALEVPHRHAQEQREKDTEKPSVCWMPEPMSEAWGQMAVSQSEGNEEQRRENAAGD